MAIHVVGRKTQQLRILPTIEVILRHANIVLIEGAAATTFLMVAIAIADGRRRSMGSSERVRNGANLAMPRILRKIAHPLTFDATLGLHVGGPFGERIQGVGEVDVM